MTKRIKPGYLLGVIVILLLTAVSFALLQGISLPTEQVRQGLDGQTAEAAKAAAMGRALGLISIIPVVLTVALAFLTKEVVPALLAGVFSGFIILVGTNGSGGGFFTKLAGVFSGVSSSIVKTTTDGFHGAILILCLCIGGMVSVINVSGGFGALGKKLTKGINSPKRATIMAQVMGMCLFFDDYANSLITGPVMKHITDKQGVSREKLAYIVDSTAAPVAGIAVISSWIAAELSAIESGFAIAGIEGSAYGSFLGSIPFCFYNFIAIAIVFATALMGREYGPMLAAERRARGGEPLKGGTPEGQNDTGAVVEAGNIWSAVLPVATMIICSFGGFYVSGVANAQAAGLIPAGAGFSLSLVPVAFENADTVAVLMQAALLSSMVAIFMGCFTGKTTMPQAVGAWFKGASGILLTVVILVLAWTLSNVIAQLGTAYYFAELVTVSLPYWALPMLIFISCCIISFAAGSFGCMVLVMPIAIPVAYQAAGLAVGYEEQYVFACVAAVLSGSIFGDHCSPVTDTTILSSLGAGCDNLDHVKTQLPYALTVAAIASLLGYLPAGLGVSPWLSLPVGILSSVLIIRFAGKKVEASADKAFAAEVQ